MSNLNSQFIWKQNKYDFVADGNEDYIGFDDINESKCFLLIRSWFDSLYLKIFTSGAYICWLIILSAAKFFAKSKLSIKWNNISIIFAKFDNLISSTVHFITFQSMLDCWNTPSSLPLPLPLPSLPLPLPLPLQSRITFLYTLICGKTFDESKLFLRSMACLKGTGGYYADPAPTSTVEYKEGDFFNEGSNCYEQC